MPFKFSEYSNCLLFITGLSVLLFISVSCSEDVNREQSAVSHADSTIFSEQTDVQYAEGFSLTYHSNYKLLEILNPFQDVTDTLRYVLKPREITLDEEFKDARIVEIPVRSIIITSTTHIGFLNMLNAGEVIKGVQGAGYVYDEEIRRSLREGEITSFTEGTFNREQALAMNPDLIMISGGQSARFGEYRILVESGIEVLVNSEWLETTPLGKAEWVKMIAALLNKEAEANEQFSKVKERYHKLKALANEAEEKPVVLSNMPYRGEWFVPGGGSFTAQLFYDAGAQYPWSDQKTTGGLRLDFESVYEVGLKADVWINPGTARSPADILAKDERFGAFKPFETGRIYNNNRRTNDSGGNDFWESGVVHPEQVLADLIHIFHPSVLPDHQLYYYRKVQ